LNRTKTKTIPPSLKKKKVKETAEEREWKAHEDGHKEGYESGVMDWEEVERRKAIVRAKGIPVIGDKKMYEHIRKKLLDIIEAVKANPDIYEYIDITEKDLEEMAKELEELDCATLEVV
jgi:hypothetical protein